MAGIQPVIYVVDDAPGIRASLDSLLRAKGFRVQTFKSARDFLHSGIPDEPGCLLLDVRMPEMNGLDLQDELMRAGIHVPIIFMTAHGDVSESVCAMKAGAEEFLTKPFRHQILLDAIQQTLKRDLASREQRTEVMDPQKRLQSLTPRERQVMELVVSGLLNKKIARELGISEVTVKLHRRKIMQKMLAASLAELVRMSERAGAPGCQVGFASHR